MLLQESGKGLTGELAALVGVEDIRSAFSKCFFQRLDAKVGIQGVGQPPGEHIPAVPVDDGHQVEKSTCHGDVGYISRPNLIRPGYLHPTEQVRVDFMPRCWFARPGMPVDGLEPHYAHESPDSFTVDPPALTLKTGGYFACPVKRRGQVLTVNQLHVNKILFRNPFRLVVQAGAADIQ